MAKTPKQHFDENECDSRDMRDDSGVKHYIVASTESINSPSPMPCALGVRIGAEFKS